MAADSVKDKVAATEPEVATTTVRDFIPVRYGQQCLLCENTRPLPEGMHYCSTPWVCDECKEAIAFVKEFRAGIKEVPADKAKEIEARMALL